MNPLRTIASVSSFYRCVNKEIVKQDAAHVYTDDPDDYVEIAETASNPYI